MDVLYFFAEHRNTFLTVFFEIARFLGEEAFALLIIGYLYLWKDKRLAYEIGFAYFISGIAANTIKVIFQIPRPWIIDSEFKPLESAIATATGYSFPSCHSQAAASIYGTVGASSNKKGIKTACVAAFLLVGLSRMYAGVHTPLDVCTGLAIGIAAVIVERKFIHPLIEKDNPAIAACVILAIGSILSVIIASVLIGKGALDPELAADAFKIAGAGVAFSIAYPLDVMKIHFDNAATTKVKVIRLILGVASLLTIKGVLKVLFAPLGDIGHFIRYIIVVGWIMIAYPMILMAIKNKKSYNK